MEYETTIVNRNNPAEALEAVCALAALIKRMLWMAEEESDAPWSALREAQRLVAGLETVLGRPGAVPVRAAASESGAFLSPPWDTPASRRYAETLQQAWEAGLAVERERYGTRLCPSGSVQAIERALTEVEQEIGGVWGRCRSRQF